MRTRRFLSLGNPATQTSQRFCQAVKRALSPSQARLAARRAKFPTSNTRGRQPGANGVGALPLVTGTSPLLLFGKNESPLCVGSASGRDLAKLNFWWRVTGALRTALLAFASVVFPIELPRSSCSYRGGRGSPSALRPQVSFALPAEILGGPLPSITRTTGKRPCFGSTPAIGRLELGRHENQPRSTATSSAPFDQ